MKQNNFLKIVLLVGDVLLMSASLFLAMLFRNKDLTSQFSSFFADFFVLYIIWIFIIFVLSLYDLNFFKKITDFIFNLVVFSVLAFFIGVTYFYFRPTFGLTPKTVLLLNVIIFAILFLVWRCLFNLFLEVSVIKEKAIIVGYHKRLKEVLPQIKKVYEVAAIFCPSYLGGQKQCLVSSCELKVVSEIFDFKNIVTEKNITSIIFALDFYSNEDLVKGIFTALPLTLNYVGIEELYEFVTKKVSLDHLNEIWFLEKVSRSEDIFGKIVKRLFDVALSILSLFLFIIFLPFAALAIKLDSNGSIFFTQKRPGKDGKLFTIYKFRTLTDNPEDKRLWREKTGDNVTRAGKLLRRLHLDELPQAWNIFKGDMSFVGPRPEPLEHALIFEKKIPFYKQRYLVKPGLIGWAQINFKASQSVEEGLEKFEYDLYYIKNRSLLLDLEIILKAIKLFIF